jgi:hypothetical protein
MPLKSQLGVNKFSIGWGSETLYVNGLSPVSFGSKILQGDLISVEVNITDGTVSYYRNEAFIGIAVGPPNSKAAVQVSLGDGPYFPAVSLSSLGDSVSFAKRTNFTSISTTFNENMPSSKASNDSLLPDWFIPLRESITLLRSCAARELPVSVIKSEFLPQCSDRSKIVVETSHPYNGENLERSLSIEGAQSLQIFIDKNTRLGAGDIVRLEGEKTHIYFYN